MVNEVQVNNAQVRSRDSRVSWGTAYRRFLLSRNEPLLLKAAPLALIGILPPELLSNLIPGIGFLDDAGYIVLLAVVAYQTITHVSHYR